jgi:DNA-binding beta-propeller fold protein YncE
MHSQIATFARMANGSQAPARRIFGQITMMNRDLHDIRYNARRDEIVVPNNPANAILTFRGGANGQEAPIRIIQGRNMPGLYRLTIDEVHDEIYTIGGGGGGVLVYPIDGNGDVPPKRILRGPDTLLGGGNGIAVDPINNLLVTTGQGDSILIFDRMASGNTKPLRVIRGPQAQIDRINQMQVWPEGRLIFVAMPGMQGYMEPPRTFLGVWSLDDNGDVPPRWAISGDQTGMKKTFGVALNPEQKEIYVSDMRTHGVFTYSVPEIFAPVAASSR